VNLGMHIPSGPVALTAACCAAVAYLIGSIPIAFMIVRSVTGEDITEHGTGNVGAMNVRRTTGSWGWFTLAMVLDAAKGAIPVTLAMYALPALAAGSVPGWLAPSRMLLGQAALLGAVLGHNYSLWLALTRKRLTRTGKGLATGGGALLAYHPVYAFVALGVALATIALTRYMLAGQVAAAVSLPVFAIATRQEDRVFALIVGAVVYAAHHRRFVGLLQGREPKLYVADRMGPRG
jgi:acyl phosphate:glycerol-3-phosphate acyltransferase